MVNMENTDLKWIKKHYGEKFSHLCRSLFPTILETEGLLSKLLSEHFPPSRELFDDITQNALAESFKDYVFSLTRPEENKTKSSLTPEELLDKAGYILYPECQTEKDMQNFRHYYYRGSPTPVYQGGTPARYEGEELCTFNGGRLKSNRVWFAVKKDADKIKRQDFKNPRREDDYGVSVLSIQFSRSEPSILSIKNRYNHTVANPDATFGNNLDNIIPGLSQAFEDYYGINLANKNQKPFEIPGYVQAGDGKFYKYNFECNNVYYCPNNTIIQNGEVKQFDKNKAIAFDCFILDLEKKEIIDYSDFVLEDDSPDVFIESVGKIKDIKRVPSAEGLTIQITPEKGELVEIQLNKHNEIVGYANPNVTQIGNEFLYGNDSLTSIDLPNVTEIGDWFLYGNNSLKSIDLPSVTRIGNNFLFDNNSLTSIELPNALYVGHGFLRSNNSLKTINFPNVTHIGDGFLRNNDSLTSIDLPSVTRIGARFLQGNNSLKSIDLSNVVLIEDEFLFSNKSLKSVYLPNVTEVGDFFLYKNKSLKSIRLPSLTEIGNEFLSDNNSLKSIDLPNVTQIGNNFLFDNNSLEIITIPKVTRIGEAFLYNNNSLKSLELPNVRLIGKTFLFNNNSLKSLELSNVTHIGDYFLLSNNTLTSLDLPNALHIGHGFLLNNKLISRVETAYGVRVLNESDKELK